MRQADTQPRGREKVATNRNMTVRRPTKVLVCPVDNLFENLISEAPALAARTIS